MSFLPPTDRRKGRQTAIRKARSEEFLLPSDDEMVTAILETIADASETAQAAGMGWYPAAAILAEDMAQRHNVTRDTACAVIAALSPQTGWSENIRLADVALADGKASGHLGDAMAKADRLIGGEAPAETLGGRKVRSFYRNISAPLSAGAVTIDRHAVSVVVGRKISDSEYKSLTGRIGLYVRIAAAYRSAARIVGILPHEAQAIAWCAWREANGLDRKYDPTF